MNVRLSSSFYIFYFYMKRTTSAIRCSPFNRPNNKSCLSARHRLPMLNTNKRKEQLVCVFIWRPVVFCKHSRSREREREKERERDGRRRERVREREGERDVDRVLRHRHCTVNSGHIYTRTMSARPPHRGTASSPPPIAPL